MKHKRDTFRENVSEDEEKIMAFEFINKLPTPAEIKEQFLLPASCIATKAQRDEEVKYHCRKKRQVSCHYRTVFR